MLAILLILIAIGSEYFYRISVGGGRRAFMGGNEEAEKTLGIDPPSEDEMSAKFRKELDAWLDSQPGETWAQTSADGLRLHACFIPTPVTGHRIAILTHGYSADWRTMAVFARLYHRMGYAVLMPDARGHGESEGKYVGFGWPDRMDVLEWIQAAITYDTEARIVLHGVSMGAATVMMVSGETLPAAGEGYRRGLRLYLGMGGTPLGAAAHFPYTCVSVFVYDQPADAHPDRFWVQAGFGTAAGG